MSKSELPADLPESVPFDINVLRKKQIELIERVPHKLNEAQELSMVNSIQFLSAFFEYLNSTGHKPWRPGPLPDEQRSRMKETMDARYHDFKYHNPHDNPMLTEREQRLLVSCHGIIEETIEFFEALIRGDKTRTDVVEEYTDIQFFYLEAGVFASITPDELMAMYLRKHARNLQRYESLEKGDTSWDKRGEDGL